LLDTLVEGALVSVAGDRVMVEGVVVARGERQSVDGLTAKVDEARRSVGVELERFAANILEYLKRERHLAVDEPDLPPVHTALAGRHALAVVRGADYRDDLAALKVSGYLRELKPVPIGVDGGADALLELGLRPHTIIGDFDSVSERALRCGAELIVHAYPGSASPGAERLSALGLPFEVFESPGTSEDIALLPAYEKGVELIVAVGTHNSLEDFLDKGRAGMSSTFLVRLKVGHILVDAGGVNRLYRPVVRRGDLVLLAISMLLALLAVVAVSEPGRPATVPRRSTANPCPRSSRRSPGPIRATRPCSISARPLSSVRTTAGCSARRSAPSARPWRPPAATPLWSPTPTSPATPRPPGIARPPPQ
jgi:uncharacterized membrane-anchored protein